MTNLITCSICSVDKSSTEFQTYLNKSQNKYYTKKQCNVCRSEKQKVYYKAHREKYIEHNKNFKIKNPDYMKTYRENNKEYFNNYMKNYYLTNENVKIAHNLQMKLTRCVLLVNNKMKDIIGCEIHEFIKWINFTKKYNCIDDDEVIIEHLLSPKNFNLSDEDEIKKYMHWTNIRFMSKTDNNIKNQNLEEEDEHRHKYLVKCYQTNTTPEIAYKRIYT
jgi:hypothetical protein